jgi:hypothetical protein
MVPWYRTSVHNVHCTAMIAGTQHKLPAHVLLLHMLPSCALVTCLRVLLTLCCAPNMPARHWALTAPAPYPPAPPLQVYPVAKFSQELELEIEVEGE